jgi:hypothetical protein
VIPNGLQVYTTALSRYGEIFFAERNFIVVGQREIFFASSELVFQIVSKHVCKFMSKGENGVKQEISIKSITLSL